VRRTEVPIIVVLKAMGVESDQEALTLIGPEPGLAALLAPSLEEAASTLEIYSQLQALEYLCECCPAARTSVRDVVRPKINFVSKRANPGVPLRVMTTGHFFCGEWR
jgi:hypothetical protein